MPSHIGAIDPHGELAGTARVVQVERAWAADVRALRVFPYETELHGRENPRLVEVGRLSWAAAIAGRRSDARRPRRGAEAPRRQHGFAGHDRRGQHEDVFLTLLKGLYQAAKRDRRNPLARGD